MAVIRMTVTPEPDGALHLTIPVGEKNGLFDVEVVVTPKVSPNGTHTEPGWPPGYFERTYGSITDESFTAPPRPPAKPVEPLG